MHQPEQHSIIGTQEVIYTPIDSLEYKPVAWMNPQTSVSYIIRETRGNMTSEASIAGRANY